MNSELKTRGFFLRALTPLHVGVGRGGEVVDLPVQRDEFGFPCIWASSLKGGLRSSILRASGNSECVKLVFGPDPASAEVSEHSSVVSVLDAKLLLIPVRSIKGIWVYATSPHLLSYLANYLEIQGKSWEGLAKVKTGVASKDIAVADNTAVLNESYVQLKGLETGMVSDLFSGVLPQTLMKRIEERGLVILDDELMREMVQRSMLIQYRVRLRRDTKTVEQGPWSEEYLPEGSVLVSLLVCRSPPPQSSAKCDSVTDACAWIEDQLRKLGGKLWLGGKETLGRGFIEASLV